MSRRSKIIVSVAGIFIILLALIGITYGYFLTRVTGNTKENSILITTANLELVYGDGTTELLTKENIMPNTIVATKDFTVTNTGDSTITYEVYLENIFNNFENWRDVELTITCQVDGGTCDGYAGKYPRANTEIITNTIEKDKVHNYEVTVKFVDTGLDQSVDMGKTLKGKVQIYNPTDIINVEGTITGYSTNHYIEYNRVVSATETAQTLTSQIFSDGTYYINGLKPGTYTVSIKSLTDNSVVASQNLSVIKGTTPSTGTNSITMTDLSVLSEINITLSDSTLSLSPQGVYDESPAEWFNITSEGVVTVNEEYPQSSNLVIPKKINNIDSVSFSSDYISNLGTVVTQKGLTSIHLNPAGGKVFLSSTIRTILTGGTQFAQQKYLSKNNQYLFKHDNVIFTVTGELMMFNSNIETYTLPEFTTSIINNSNIEFSGLRTLNITENVAKVLTIAENAFSYANDLTVNIYTSKENTSLEDPVNGSWYGSEEEKVTVNWITE